MKGDFSYLEPTTPVNDTAVLHQQGRVLLDRDWNEAVAIEAQWRDAVGRDAFGSGVLAVPSSGVDAFRVIAAQTDLQTVQVTLDAGGAWADGLHVVLPAAADRAATYLGPVGGPGAVLPQSIRPNARDLVVLDVYEDIINGFQEPADLIEPALGGPDTTERTRAFMTVRLIRLAPDEDCSAVRGALDDPATRGRVTVTPSPVINIVGDCPIDAGGGYTGLEHWLYRIEITDPAAGRPRFKWSQFNGGLVGRGQYTSATANTGVVNITANQQMIAHCGLPDFYFEALQYDALEGRWVVRFTANAALNNGALSLTNASGVWPAPANETAFFRLWNGIRRVADFAPGAANNELKEGIHVEFAGPFNATRYVAGDYWTFPVRAAGAAFDPAKWPTNAPPQGIRHRRVALGIVTWGPDNKAIWNRGDIEDCRRVFRPLTNQKVCCTFHVGDGVNSHGDFDSIEEALRHLPSSGGKICLLPGTHQANAVIDGRADVTIKGCGARTRVIPRQATPNLPIFRIAGSRRICLDHMVLTTLGGSAIIVEPNQNNGSSDVEIVRNEILACVSAIRVTGSTGLDIHHNRIRLLDKQSASVAIYLAADDSIIAYNDIRLLHRRVTPPFRPPKTPGPIDPSDPCARPDLAYIDRRFFVSYLAAVFTVKLPKLPLILEPYLALGGIQIAGGSERVRVLENVVVGGAGNGITLGSLTPAAAQPAPAPAAAQLTIQVTTPAATIAGTVTGPNNIPIDGAQVTVTSAATGTQTKATSNGGRFAFEVRAGAYTVTATSAGLEADGFVPVVITDNGITRTYITTLRLRRPAAPPAPVDEDGFLYDIVIERNEISAMGLSGIGVASTLATPTQATLAAPPMVAAKLVDRVAAARDMLGSPVIRLEIRGNHIHDCLRNPFDRPLRDEAARRGLGGISLGMCEEVLIDDNRIEHNGLTDVNPTCGIFVTWGEQISITHNRVVENGELPSARAQLVAGIRGGIVLRLATGFSPLSQLRGARTIGVDPLPAARIHNNVVHQPVGQALFIRAAGPVMCSDNAFASERSGPSDVEQNVGTVMIQNVGGVQYTDAQKQINKASFAAVTNAAAPAGGNVAGAAAAAAAATARTIAAAARRTSPVAANFARPEAAFRVLTGGATQFHDNQSRTGATNTSAICHLIAVADDLGYQGNHSTCASGKPLTANVMLRGDSIRAALNRMTERGSETVTSMWTVAARMNDTSLNQGDHCIIATDLNPAMTEIKVGNQVLAPSPTCGRINTINVAAFKATITKVNP